MSKNIVLRSKKEGLTFYDDYTYQYDGYHDKLYSYFKIQNEQVNVRHEHMADEKWINLRIPIPFVLLAQKAHIIINMNEQVEEFLSE